MTTSLFPASLPRVALDPLAEFVGVVTLKGVEYGVTPLSAAAYSAAVHLVAYAKAVKEAREKGESVPAGEAPDPELLFRSARSVLPGCPAEVLDSINPQQATVILLTAAQAVAEVEKLFPKVTGGPDSTPPTSSPVTSPASS